MPRARPTRPLLAAAALALSAAPGLAVSPLAFELEEIDRDLAVEREKVAALESLAKRQVVYNQRWIEWWTKVEELVTAAQKGYEEQLEERRKKLAKIEGLYRGIQGSEGNLYVPRTGWVTAKRTVELLTRAREEAEAFRKLVADARDNWWIVAVGWITSGGVRGKIEGLEAENRAIQEAVKDGSFHAWFVSHGWLRLDATRRRIGELEARADGLQAAAEEGTYRVHVPGHGWETRKGLESKLAAVEERIQALKGAHDRGEMSITRKPYQGGYTEEAVDARLEEDAASFATMETLVGKGLYQVWFKGDGHVTRDSLEEDIAAVEERLAEVRDQVKAGTYRVSALGHARTQQEIEAVISRLEERLALPDLRENVRKTTQESLETARKFLAAIPQVSAYEVFTLTLEKTLLTRQVAFLMRLAEPDFERRKLVRDQLVGWKDEFRKNLALALAPLEAERERLERIRKVWFPRS